MRIVIINLFVIGLLSGCVSSTPVSSQITTTHTANGGTELNVNKSQPNMFNQNQLPNLNSGSTMGSKMISPLTN